MKVISANYEKTSAGIAPLRLFCRGRVHVPIAVTLTKEDAGKSGARTVGGAVVGGVLMGGAGAIVGAMASGNKGHAYFEVTTLGGERLLCHGSMREYHSAARIITKGLAELEARKALVEDPDCFARRNLLPSALAGLVFGPLALAAYGRVPFILGLLAAAVTGGLGWPAMCLVAPFLQMKEHRRWLQQHGDALRSLDIGGLREARQQAWRLEHGLAA